MKAKNPQEPANEQTIRKLYSLAEDATKDTQGFGVHQALTRYLACHGGSASPMSIESTCKPSHSWRKDE